MKRPITIGLTGAIGTGKSTVASMMKARGAEVVTGDELGRQALEDSPPALAAVRARFGGDVFRADGCLDRRALGHRVFASVDDVAWLTRLTFPRIHELWKLAVENSEAQVIVFDAALILEWGIEDEFDFLLAVTASEESVRERMAGQDRLTGTEAAARRRMQMTPESKADRADTVIRNDGSWDQLKEQVDQFWRDTIAPEIDVRKRRHAPKN